jgi:hypothetical protein
LTPKVQLLKITNWMWVQVPAVEVQLRFKKEDCCNNRAVASS